MAVKQLEANLRRGTQLELTSQRTRRKVICTVGELVGHGGSAKVYGGTLDSDGSQIVLKCQRFEGDPDPAFQHEIRLFKTLSHRNIIHCVGIGVTRHGQLVMGFRRGYANPLFTLGDEKIAKELRLDSSAKYTNLPLDTAIDLGYELLRALRYLERQGLVHHDVKLANLLIDVGPNEERLRTGEIFSLVVRRKYRGVLIDFGATRTRDELEALNSGESNDARPPQITPLYAPPESVVERRRPDGSLGRIFDPTVDAYAAAMVIYAMITGHPPYSHLERPLNYNDFESVVNVKSAESRGDIVPISADVIQRVLHQGTSFLEDRSQFDLGLYRFLAQRLSPDSTERGTITDMVVDFEKLMHIDTGRSESGVHSIGGGGKAYLPFGQELVKVGTGTGEHPLLKASRLYAETMRFDRLPEETLAEPSRKKKEQDQQGPSFDRTSGLTFLDEMWGGEEEGPPPPAGKPTSQAATKNFSRAEMLEHVNQVRARQEDRGEPEEADEPRRPPREANAQERADLLARALGPEDDAESVARQVFRFHGSTAGLTARYLTRALLVLVSLPTLLLALHAALVRPSPDGLPAQLLAQALAPLGDPLGWPLIGEHWTRITEQLSAVPAAPLLFGWVVMLILIDRLTASIRLYRLRRSTVFGSTLIYRPSMGLGGALVTALLLVLTAGLALPWVAVRGKRKMYRSCYTASGLPLEFLGGGFQWIGLALITLLLFPLAIGTLGLLAIPIAYLWHRWELTHLVLPDNTGQMQQPRCAGGLGSYFGNAFIGWLASLLTLGLARPWATVRSWRWFDEHIVS